MNHCKCPICSGATPKERYLRAVTVTKTTETTYKLRGLELPPEVRRDFDMALAILKGALSEAEQAEIAAEYDETWARRN